MIVAVSTPWVRSRFGAAAAGRLGVERWIVRRAVPEQPHRLLSLVGAPPANGGRIILFQRYGRREAERFPPVCLEGWLISLVVYRHERDLAAWLLALDRFRSRSPRDAVVLCMMKPFYMRWAERFHRELRGSRYRSAGIQMRGPDTTTKEELAERLSEGCALAIYMGHGRSRGWSGYRGFRWRDVERFDATCPVGALISLSCSSLRQDKARSVPSGLTWVMSGRSCAFFGACGPVEVEPLATIASLLLEALSLPEITRLDELIRCVDAGVRRSADPAVQRNWETFRLIGSADQPLG